MRRRVGVGDFQPGLQSAAEAGIKVSRAPYPAGAAGTRMSLEEMAKRIREGQLDPGIIELAHKTLAAAGFRGRGAQAGSTRQRADALLRYVREWLLYAPDQPGTERIASAAALACLRPNLCIRIADCDEQSILLGSLLGAAGIPAVILKQSYGVSAQEHVLIEFQDDDGSWLPADPSTDMPLGQKAQAVEEVRVDPLDQVGATGTAGAEIITLGAPRSFKAELLPGAMLPPNHSPVHQRFHQGNWWHHDGLRWVLLQDVGCERWGAVMRNPPAALAAEASRRIAASGGDAVAVEWNGGRYLFTQEPGGGIYIRPCIDAVGVGALFGCSYEESKTFRERLIAPWHALRFDIEACAGLTLDQKTDFNFDFESFQSWYDGLPANRIFCDDAERADIEVGRDLEARLNRWRKIISGVNCQLGSPELPPLTPDDPRNPDYDLSVRPTTMSEIKNVVVTAAIVAGVGAGVYLAFPLLKAAAELGADALRGRKKRRV